MVLAAKLEGLNSDTTPYTHTLSHTYAQCNINFLIKKMISFLSRQTPAIPSSLI